jgi:hypothetical protein
MEEDLSVNGDWKKGGLPMESNLRSQFASSNSQSKKNIKILNLSEKEIS